METDAHAHVGSRWPRVIVQAALGGYGRGNRIDRRWEHAEERVALGPDLNTAMVMDSRADHVRVSSEEGFCLASELRNERC